MYQVSCTEAVPILTIVGTPEQILELIRASCLFLRFRVSRT